MWQTLSDKILPYLEDNAPNQAFNAVARVPSIGGYSALEGIAHVCQAIAGVGATYAHSSCACNGRVVAHFAATPTQIAQLDFVFSKMTGGQSNVRLEEPLTALVMSTPAGQTLSRVMAGRVVGLN